MTAQEAYKLSLENKKIEAIRKLETIRFFEDVKDACVCGLFEIEYFDSNHFLGLTDELKILGYRIKYLDEGVIVFWDNN